MTIVPDFDPVLAKPRYVAPARPALARGAHIGGSNTFWRMKACIDVVGSLMLLLVVVVLAALLLLLNPIFNPGPLLFRQERLGYRGHVFTALKFRTMTYAPNGRGPDDPLEIERISRFGRLLRRTGLDELPQVINILRGEMSLIGPRPDCARHAQAYLDTIPEYRQRLCIKPGMSGYAQITLGYAVGYDATRAKACADLDYIARAGFGLEMWITWRTILMVLMARGD